MAAKWGNHEGEFKELSKPIAKFSLKATKAQVDLFLKSYKAAVDLEAKLAPALIKAVSNGVKGDTLVEYRKDKGFGDAFKAFDKAVRAAGEAQGICKQMANDARMTINEIKVLVEHLEKDLAVHDKELKDALEEKKKHDAKVKAGKATAIPSMLKALETQEKDFKKRSGELEKLRLEMLKDVKDLTEAANCYKTSTDQKMESYASKFDKTIDKILDLAPKSEKSDGPVLPAALQEKVLVVAAKKAVLSGKEIEKHCRYALEKAEKGAELAQPELKAARVGLDALKKVKIQQAGARKKFAAQIKASGQEKELIKYFKMVETAFGTAEKALRDTFLTLAKKK